MAPKPKPSALDAHQIQTLAEWGCTDTEIAELANIAERTLQRRFRKQLNVGRANLRKNIRAAQIKAAIEHLNPAMLIWLGKQYLRQRDIAPIRADDDLEQRVQNIVVELTEHARDAKQPDQTATNDH